MATNKNAMIRYQSLDRCFGNPGRRYFIEDLVEECNKAILELEPNYEGVKRRQIFYDIRFMESAQGWSIPLERIDFGNRKYYRYSDLKFSINNQPLNITEAAQLKSVLTILTRFCGTPQFEWVNEMVPLIEEKFGLISKKNSAISFDGNIDLRGLNHLKPLFNAIINQQVLRISYKDFKSTEPYDIVFHPYYLKQFNNRWFVFGLNEENGKFNWNLALDRIEQITEDYGRYKEAEIDWDDYFYDIVGVTRPEGIEPQEVILRFSSKVTPYVISKPIHPTQKQKIDPTGMEISINVILNTELENLILSFGEEIIVLHPEVLKKKIADRLKNAGLLYQ